MRVSLRAALPFVAVLLCACTSASGAEKPPARQSPIAVPSAVPSATVEVEEPAPSELIDTETGEALAMRGSATMTITVGGVTTARTLTQDPDSETVIEQNEGETQRVLRLSAVEAKRADDVQFSVDGLAAPGTVKTSEGNLVVVFYDAPLGVDLLSDRGECTVVFETVAAAGADGRVTCDDVATEKGPAKLTATFKAEPTDTP